MVWLTLPASALGGAIGPELAPAVDEPPAATEGEETTTPPRRSRTCPWWSLSRIPRSRRLIDEALEKRLRPSKSAAATRGASAV